MTKQHHPQPALMAGVVEAQSVVEFLRIHPEFFTQHPEVLMEMTLQHSSGSAISLIERQVVTLRDHNRQLKRQLHGLVQIARDNDRLNERMHRLVLSLMDCFTLQDVFIGIYDSLRNDFHADAVVMRLMAKPKIALNVTDDNGVSAISDNGDVLFVDKNDMALDAFRGFLKAAKPVCGHLGVTQMNYLFGDQAGTVASAALIPLCGIPGPSQLPVPAGVIAVGSYDPERFHHGMGTHFLSQMGEIINRAVRPYLATE